MAVKKITESGVNGLSVGESIRDTVVTGFRAERKAKAIYFYFRYKSQKGKRSTIKIGAHGSLTVQQAREIAQAMAGDVAKGNDPAAERKEVRKEQARKEQSTLRAFLHGGFLDVTANKTAADVIARVSNHFKDFLDKPMSDITPWQLEKWKRAFTGKASACNRELTALRGVFSKAVKAGIVGQSPMPHVKNLKEDKNQKIRFLTVEEERLLLEAVDNRQEQIRTGRLNKIKWCIERKQEPPEPHEQEYIDHIKPMVIIALQTGMRRGELFNLRVADLDLPGRMLTVVGSGAKSRQTRFIPLNDTAFHCLTTWLNQTGNKGLVFPSPVTGERLDNIYTVWEGLRKLSGLPDVRLHDLRHTFGTRLAHERVDLVTIKELMGHESLDTTARYLHTSNERKFEAVSVLV